MNMRFIDAAILVAMILLSGWVSSEFGQVVGRNIEASVATNYQTMALLALVVAIGATFNFVWFEFVGFEHDFRQTAPYLVVGGIAGFLITSSGKLALTKIITPGAIDPTLGFIYVLILAVFVETYLFVCALYPSIAKFLSGRTNNAIAKVVAAAIVCFLFAIWHVVATGGDQSRLVGEFIFCAFMVGSQELTKTAATPIAIHFARNLFTGG